MHFKVNHELRTDVETRLAAFDVREVEGENLRRAAVGIVIAAAERDDSACVLLTLRPSTLNRHGGQYALPGGRMDAGETPEQTALRELEEELGVCLPATNVIGRLDDFPTRSGFRITPLVIWGGPDLRLRPDPREVEKVFRIPFIELDSPEIPRFDPGPGQQEPVFSAPLATLGHHLYAPTAAMLYQFREVVLRGAPTRVAHYEQPQFAWQ